jgi:hypothetical protein
MESNEEKGLRYNEGKIKWSLVDFESLESMARVLMYGAEKYTVKDEEGNVLRTGANNWKKGMVVSEVCESLLRHTFALMRGEVTDPESGESHVGHMMCNCMFIDYNMRNKPEFNDLPKIETNE